MSEKKTVPFQGTPQQEQQLLAVIERHKDERGALIPVLHEAQDIYGYLPEDARTLSQAACLAPSRPA